MQSLIELIARSLVDRPDEVSVSRLEEGDEIVLELRVAPDDLGKVIGREGRTARALRHILGVAGLKQRTRFVLEILE